MGQSGTVNRRTAVMLLLAAVLAAGGRADDKGAELPAPRRAPDGGKQTTGQPILPPSAVEGLYPAVPVHLYEVLQLGSIANLDIAQANLVVERARAAVLGTKSLFLPSLNLGSTYTEHEGTIQRTEGTVVNANRDALFVGMGTGLTVSISDAIFAVPEARRRLEATLSGRVTVTNDSLLRIAEAYFATLRARRQLARLDEVLNALTSDRESALRGNSKGLLPLIEAFVKAGTALPSDQTRVEADVVRRMSERSRASQDVRTASAELARLLHLNATVFLLPAEDFRGPLNIAGQPWFDQPLDALVAQGLSSRPELAENASLLEAAILRYKAAKYRPALPYVVGNYSYGGFGGGPPIVGRTSSGSPILGHSGVIADFGQRHDIEIGLQWRLQGLGLGNYAQAWDARVGVEQRQVQQLFLQDLVVRDVVQAQEQMRRAAERVAVTRAGLFDDQGRATGAIYQALRLNFTRIRGGQGLPLEVLDSTRRLSDVLSEYANAVTDYDAARFRLLVALGLPPSALIDPRMMPLPPGCAAPPPAPVATSPAAPAKEVPRTLPPPRQAQAPAPAAGLPDDGLHALPPASKRGGS